MQILPHNFVISPVTQEFYCSNCGITENAADTIGSVRCTNFSYNEKVAMAQHTWFAGYFDRQLARLDKQNG